MIQWNNEIMKWKWNNDTRHCDCKKCPMRAGGYR